MIRYEIPEAWVRYDPQRVAEALAEAKAAIIALRSTPYQRRWVETLQQVELKREVAGTSRIEGAEFTEPELDAALRDTPKGTLSRSQRQARSAQSAYRFIAEIPSDRPVDAELIRTIHRLFVEGADDDHCPPGQLRAQDQNVTFGNPSHRGAEGGNECARAFAGFVEAIRAEFPRHDPLVQAVAAHYHFAAMHPFLDGNGRTARALEALFLQRAGLRDTCFVAVSNFYYDEKIAYLAALSESRQHGHDLTPILLLSLRAIASQSQRVLGEISTHVAREVFRGLALDFFGRLQSPRKRVIAQRQVEILTSLLEVEWMPFADLVARVDRKYQSLKNPDRAIARDLAWLHALGAIQTRPYSDNIEIGVRLEWPTEITESRFFEVLKELPRAKSLSFFSKL